MTKITRMILFTALAFYLTSWWNKGFVLSADLRNFFITVAIFSVVYYFVVPLSKLLLLPLNVITLGLVSTIVYIVIFYLVITRLSYITIKSWDFPGASFGGFTLQKTHVTYVLNLILSSVSISTIINLLEKVL